jgi:hypothetical protein
VVYGEREIKQIQIFNGKPGTDGAQSNGLHDILRRNLVMPNLGTTAVRLISFRLTTFRQTMFRLHLHKPNINPKKAPFGPKEETLQIRGTTLDQNVVSPKCR